MTRVAGSILLALSLAISVEAQTPAAGARARVLEEARRLANAGEVGAARLLVDSLARETPSDALDFPQILFLRASVAGSVLDAGLDYEKIVSAFPASALSKESLLRLAQRALVAGDALKALAYLQTLSRNYPEDASRAAAEYWKARALLDSHDVAAACSANREAMLRAKASSSPLRGEIESQGLAACGHSPAIALVEADTTKLVTRGAISLEAAVPGARTYAVQVSALDTRQDAEAMAAHLKKNGMDAHVDGKARPFRVRIGYFPTFAAATKALRELQSRNISGFVAEMIP